MKRCSLALLLLVLPAVAGAQVLPGIDVLVRRGFDGLEGKRVGLVINQTSLRRDIRQSTLEAFLATNVCHVTALFGPEHGIDASEAAGDAVNDQTDRRTGLPVYSLYGATRKPTPAMLRNVDVMVYDIQDIGVRSYTYISTLINVMEACAEAGIPLIVLDRPDPIGGDVVDGPVLDINYRSFVGIVPIPYVYGLTPGELATMANGEGWLANGLRCRLRVVRMRGWHRSMTWGETGLTWVPTSPHVPTQEAAFALAITGAIGELGIVNIGVGYTLPFQLVGAPWIDGDSLARRLNRARLTGLYFRRTAYKPFYAMSSGTTCYGVHLMRIGENAAPFKACIAILATLRDLYPERNLLGSIADEKWKTFDKVCGTDQIRLGLLRGDTPDALAAAWRRPLGAYISRREDYLLYE
ncbi:MAG: DUF1343 domain-containing protein [Bacteroidetes bacterium]|nr:DUF1343 domain-containing protein [Bacteroidota bacterium]